MVHIEGSLPPRVCEQTTFKKCIHSQIASVVVYFTLDWFKNCPWSSGYERGRKLDKTNLFAWFFRVEHVIKPLVLTPVQHTIIMSTLCYIILPLVVLMGLLRKCRERSWGKCKDKSSLQDKTFLVTGANSGIGKVTVQELVRRHARVIMACRNLDSAREAITDIRKTVSTGEMIPMELDLASLTSIRNFSEQVLKDFPEIHGLINNAGVYVPLKDRAITKDGFEIHFLVNHLGHFLLTNLLLDRLKLSAPSRIVIVTSKLLERGTIDFSNLNGEKVVPATGRMNPGYYNSKLANAYFGTELAKNLENTGVNVYMVCPGFTYTGLFRNVKRSWFHYVMFFPVALLYLRTAYQGAQTVLHCATDASLAHESGFLYRDCKIYRTKKEIEPDVASKLWEISTSLTGVDAMN